MYFVYLLKCKSDSSLYCGSTNDLSARALAHNQGKGSKYVRSRGGGKIVYFEKLDSKNEALKRESAIKRLNRGQKLTLIKNHKTIIDL